MIAPFLRANCGSGTGEISSCSPCPSKACRRVKAEARSSWQDPVSHLSLSHRAVSCPTWRQGWAQRSGPDSRCHPDRHHKAPGHHCPQSRDTGAVMPPEQCRCGEGPTAAGGGPRCHPDRPSPHTCQRAAGRQKQAQNGGAGQTRGTHGLLSFPHRE